MTKNESGKRDARIDQIFEKAVNLAPRDRADYLEKTCPDDSPSIRAEVEKLLEVHEEMEGETDFLRDGPFFQQKPDTSLESPGAMIGDYKLLQQIGEGGFGVVYMADQEKPIQTRVALKVIKPGMDSKQVIARFEAERQALAMMDHPNIARVFDAGVTENGRPYFVMELVKGIPITQFCDDQKLTLRERLDLFLPVCRAIQHAHLKGIIHRDIKPSNLLVSQYDGERVPKVIDFGVAKAVHQRLTDRTMFTQFGQVIGTLEYMSPEQSEMNQLDVDTRSDIYSLGAVLYELLTGVTPIGHERFRDAAFDEMLRLIRDEEPLRPSVRLSTDEKRVIVSQQRQIDSDELAKNIRGELDWIVMKALDKQRARRYETASDFAKDLERYLGNEPVEAGPPSTTYRLKKLLAKHRQAITMASCFVIVLCLATVISIWQAIRATNAEQEANTERNAVIEEQAKTELALRQLDTQSKKVEAYAEQSRKRLIRSYVDQGVRLLDGGDPMSSIVWFTEALKLDQGRPDRERVHRMRIAATLKQCPKLTRVWFHDAAVRHAEFSPDGSKCVTASNNQAYVWDIATGRMLTSLVHDRGAKEGTQNQRPVHVNHAAFSPDGTQIVTASSDFINRKRTTESGESVKETYFLARVWAADSGNPVTPWLEHPSIVESATFSPEGDRVVTACRDGIARVWDVSSGNTVCECLHNNHWVTHCEFSPDGKYVLTACGRLLPKFFKPAPGMNGLGGARIFDAASGKPTIPNISKLVHYASFSSDGRRFVSASAEGARVWDSMTGAPVSPPLTRVGQDGEVVHASFSPDGRRIVTARSDGGVDVWDALTGNTLIPRMEHPGSVQRVSFSADGHRILTACKDGFVRIWNLANGKQVTSPLKHGEAASRAQFKADGRHVLSASNDGTVRIWDLANGEPTKTPLHLHDAVQYATFSRPHGHYIFTLAFGGATRVWDANSASPTTPLLNDARVLFNASGRLMATAGANQTTEIRDATTGDVVVRVDGEARDFSEDGDRLVTVKENKAQIWSTRTGQPLSEPMEHRTSSNGATTIRSAGFEAQDQRVVTTHGGTMKAWDGDNGQRLNLPVKHDKVRFASFSPNGRCVVTMSSRGRLWDAATGVQIGDAFPHHFYFGFPFLAQKNARPTFSPDSSRLFIQNGKEINILEVATGKLTTLKHDGYVFNAVFRHDGRRILTISSDKTARIWDARTGASLIPPIAHGGSHSGAIAPNARFSPDGRFVVTASIAARVWDAETGLAITPKLHHGDLVWYAEFSPDGDRVVSAGADGQVRRWDLPQDSRPVEDLVLLGHVVSGNRIDSNGGLTPFDPASFQTAWQQLSTKYPEEFNNGPAAIAGWHRHEATHFESTNQFSDVIRHLDSVINSNRGCWGDYFSRAEAHANLKHWKLAAADFQKLIAWEARDDFAWQSLALIGLGNGDADGYASACEDMLSLCSESGESHRLARTCAIGSTAAMDLSIPLRLAKKAVASEHTFGMSTLGALLYRAGQFDAAVEMLEQSIHAQGDAGVFELLFLAMAYHPLGERAKSRELLDRAAERIKQNRDSEVSNGWRQSLSIELIHREAEMLIKAKTVDKH